MDFATVRLGKTSVEAIKNINELASGIVENMPIDVTCTQVPQEFIPDTWVFIWLGSDNNKGMPTTWKQGFKALGQLKTISRGENYNDNSTFTIDIKYIFDDAVSRLDFLKYTPQAYFWFSAMPIIGLDDHSNQTVRMIQPNAERNDIRALLYAFNKIILDFNVNIRLLDDKFKSIITGYEIQNPIDSDRKDSNSNRFGIPLQVIFYGAPGTGKSHTTDGIIAEFPDSHQRTTFHPDTDYSSFVGCYKPTEKNGKLTYKFVPQVFLKAYVEAWRNPALPYFLVIEEINRGNCAQIFGDIFQLLDRDKANGGISKYTITPDEDIRKYLEETFADGDFEHLPDLLRLGERMQLPGNLYILATMNTSDQSLFPIDSAFKRRWAWKYKPIEQGRDKQGKPYEWQIRNGNYAYDWWEFISKINEKVEDATQSEDKKMGFWFTSPENGIGYITQEDFISKVLFYLWNDIYKDFAKTDETIFKGQPVKAEGATEDPKAYEIFFTHFFRTDGSVENRVRDFMRFNGITEKEFIDPTPKDDDSESEGEDEDDSPSPDNKAHWEDFVKALAGTSIADKVNISKLSIPEVRTFELKCSDLPDCKVGASIATKKGYLRVYFWSGGNNQDIIRPIIEEDKDSILQQLSEATNGNVKICGKKVLTIEATDDTMSTEWQANAFAAFYDFFTDLLSDFQAGDTPNAKERHQQFWNRMQNAFDNDEILQGGRMMREGYGYFIPSFGREDVGIRVYHTMHPGRNGYGVGVHVLPNGAQSLKDAVKQGVEQVNIALGQEANITDNYSGIKVFYPADEYAKVDLSTDENESKAFDNIRAIAHKLYEAFKPIIEQYQE